MQKAADDRAKVVDGKLAKMAAATQRQIEDAEVRMAVAVDLKFVDFFKNKSNPLLASLLFVVIINLGILFVVAAAQRQIGEQVGKLQATVKFILYF